MCTQALQIQEILQKFASVASQPGGLSQLEPGRKPGVIPVPLVERVHYGVQLSTAQRFSVRQLCAVALLGVSSCATQSGTGDTSVANHNTEGRHTRKQVHPKHSVRDPSLYTSPRRPQVFGCGSTSCRGCRKPNGPVPSCTKPEPTPGSSPSSSAHPTEGFPTRPFSGSDASDARDSDAFDASRRIGIARVDDYRRDPMTEDDD